MQRTAIARGGTKGIGQAICRQLKSQGVKVAALYVSDEPDAEAARRELDLVARCDAADFAQCEATVAEIERVLGPVDILVNNAGITRDAALHKMTFSQWDGVAHRSLGSRLIGPTI